MEEGCLEPIMYTKDAAPANVRDLVHIYCSDAECCENRKCPCKAHGFHCTECCACEGDCNNVIVDSDSDDDET
jgi:hypothetical protein